MPTTPISFQDLLEDSVKGVVRSLHQYGQSGIIKGFKKVEVSVEGVPNMDDTREVVGTIKQINKTTELPRACIILPLLNPPNVRNGQQHIVCSVFSSSLILC